MAIDTAAALDRLNEFITLCERYVETMTTDINDPKGLMRVVEQMNSVSGKQLVAEIDNRLSIVRAVAEATDSHIAGRLIAAKGGTRIQSLLGAANELRGVVEHEAEIERITTPAGPKLAANQLHPWIWDHAARLWSDGYRREAVQSAATALFDSHLPAKLERARDTNGGYDLIGQAFSLRDPELNAFRLRLPDYDRDEDEKSWKSAHQGAMHLGQGCAMAIRNTTTHRLAVLPEQQALEMLATLSLVARLVDEAGVTRP